MRGAKCQAGSLGEISPVRYGEVILAPPRRCTNGIRGRFDPDALCARRIFHHETSSGGVGVPLAVGTEQPPLRRRGRVANS
ncbi:hypothetical protein SBBP2_1500004 [Burkholderiales bacterium]|nr:hypothetical protein SBBP2_1500004 [Burkholderiales bacterium]